ncbi:MAG: S-adenosylmethionine:tRNA ribosyltransferase-isomerase [Bacteroidetes bacterium]|nr:S-adenosylmethionine:tRNA ribosyltransferase-isomerase [Bacteroidota bacterium]
MTKHIADLRIEPFRYDLPDERIARYPLSERDESKLLVYRSGEIWEDTYRNIAAHIPTDSLLVFNNTKVIHARLFFPTATGAQVEVFCLEPAGEQIDMASAMVKKESTRWNCLIGRASKWKEKVLVMKTDTFTMQAEIVERNSDAFVVEFRWTPIHFTFAEILDRAGVMPIPPYLKRSADQTDQTRYQTVFAEYEGSVAAPTAGLHFTPRVFESFAQKNIQTTFLTLHVGAGTFKPVTAETIGAHEMHAEVICLSRATIQQIKDALERPMIPVGTTSLRTLESLYWMGVKAKLNPSLSEQEIEISQWEVYKSLPDDISASDALDALLLWMKTKGLETLLCKTQILIAPGYTLKIATALITNFHQPSSTLLLLVAAIAGGDWKKIYDYALTHDFRFLSYGDGSLIFARK